MVFVVKTISIVMMVSSVVFFSAGPIASVVLFSHLLAFSRQVKVKKNYYIFLLSVNQNLFQNTHWTENPNPIPSCLISGVWSTTMWSLKHAIYYTFKVTSAFSKSQISNACWAVRNEGCKKSNANCYYKVLFQLGCSQHSRHKATHQVKADQ